MATALLTARGAGLVTCTTCYLISRIPQRTAGKPVCPRCGSLLFSRKPNSLSRTWALLCTAAILYVPANVLPMTVSSSLGSTQADTILTGVLYFYTSGSWFIALVIFVASVFIPIFKLLTLAYLLIGIQLNWINRARDRTRLYRVTEMIGRWSMVDIFVVTLLVALIKLGALANLEAGPAGLYFAGVVIATMLAANSFDPRLIWDCLEKNDA